MRGRWRAAVAGDSGGFRICRQPCRVGRSQIPRVTRVQAGKVWLTCPLGQVKISIYAGAGPLWDAPSKYRYPPFLRAVFSLLPMPTPELHSRTNKISRG